MIALPWMIQVSRLLTRLAPADRGQEMGTLHRKSVAFDREAFLMQTSGGVSRYFSNLIREFAGNPQFSTDPVLLFRTTVNRHLADLTIDGVRTLPFVEVPAAAVKAARHQPSTRFRELTLSALGGSSARGVYDIVHVTHFQPRERDAQSGARLAVTVHDMIPELRPSDWHGRNPHNGKKELVLSADLVFCVSDTTADSLNELYGRIPGRVVTAPHGVNHAIFRPQSSPLPSQLSRPYVLYVGSRSRYKNFGVLLSALSILRKENRDLGLVIVGGGVLRRAERRIIAGLLPTCEFRHCFPSDLELAALYNGSTAFCVPSLQEGFGLPILEAMACGCPTVVSDIRVFHEVAGDAAEYFDPYSPESLANKLSEVLRDSELRKNLRTKGLGRAAGYTWHDTAKLVCEAYESVM
jgi:glycosyltransferase involved in cell wall biosynthesis